MAMAELFKNDPEALVCVVDIESSFRKEWLAKFGIPVERVTIMNAATTEEAVNMFQEAIRSEVFDIIVVDSLGAIARSVEVDGKDGKGGHAEDVVYGGSAGLISRWVRTGNAELVRVKRSQYAGEDVVLPVVLFINQQRVDIGSTYGGMKHGGGEALKHMMCTNVRVTTSNATADRLMGTSNGQDVQVGSLVKAYTEKNKLAPKNRLAGYLFVYEECPEHAFGVDTVRAVLDMAMLTGIIRSAGPWVYLYPDTPEEYKTQGKDAMVAYLKENPDVQKNIRNQLLTVVRKETAPDIKVKDDSA
jgi:RecA/RadA recombinase